METLLANKEVLAAVAGGALALFGEPLLRLGAREAPRKRRKNGPPEVCLWPMLIVAAATVGLSVHAAKEVMQSTFSVKLHRQHIPLQTDGGVVIHKSAYYGKVAVGGPEAQVFSVVLDTGSGHLVLPSTLCKTDTCKVHSRYKRKASSTAVDIDYDGTPVEKGQARDQITVSFGTGEVTGVFVKDRICFGAADDRSSAATETPQGTSLLQASKGLRTSEADRAASVVEEDRDAESQQQQGCVDLRMIAATDMTPEPFGHFEFDGVLGLGLGGLSQAPEFNFFLSAAAGGAWQGQPGREHTFAVFLAHHEDEDSEVTFGGWKVEHLKEPDREFAWVPVKNPELGYWQLDVKGVKANGVEIDYCKEGCRAIMDTGTSLVAVPTDMGPDLSQHLSHAVGGDGRCGGPGPKFEIDLGDFTVTLDPIDYARPHDEAPEESSNAKRVATRSCVPMLMFIDLPEPLGPKLLILGEPVLQRYYTAFDAGKMPRIGFGEALHKVPKEAASLLV
eukprot:gnl/TRDRNA2_/TRDRNA2_178492_c0_seq1.p1 gnl/TRDRNA2_/TRDRNA2_178492_c0~~gnl/TRDRNA2_/TRDRNA2_178492_c0_seq1.p1  ORF type:complete len:504 (+),score=100.40 gnl/TRDRNA2_/TRDRNA2_178492_c0_seq1:230-1741(+)